MRQKLIDDYYKKVKPTKKKKNNDISTNGQ